MKHIIIALPVLLFLSFGVFGQKGAGIYETAADFENGYLSHQQESVDDKYVIKTDNPFDPATVKVVKGSEKVSLSKFEVYGYKDKRNRDYRFYENARYRVIDPSPSSFYIYSRDMNVINGKARTRETRYFFSVGAGTAIHALTIHNLKNAYPRSGYFHDMLDAHFRSDKELMKYDAFYKQYKVKSVFERTIAIR